MTNFDLHPANSKGLRVGEMDVYKDRQPTVKQLKEQNVERDNIDFGK